MGRTKPIVANEYIVGLTDGEGCFYVNIGNLIKKGKHLNKKGITRIRLLKMQMNKKTIGFA